MIHLTAGVDRTPPPPSSSSETPPEQPQESTALETVLKNGITQWTSQDPLDLALRTNIVLYLIEQPFYFDEISHLPLSVFLGHSFFLVLGPLNLPNSHNRNA